MSRSERQEKILELLQKEKSVKIKDLAHFFDVSILTIRRDFDELSERGQINKVYGGAVLPEESLILPGQSFFYSRLKKHHTEKRHIAESAAALVQEGDVIALDIGTTCLELAKQLKNRRNITILTNSIPILLELMNSDLEVYSLGGQLRGSQLSLYGSIALHSLEDFVISKAFIGAGGITLENGLTNYHRDSAELCTAIIRRAERTILLVDNNKFGKNASAVIGPLEIVDTIITDNGILPQYANEITARGIKLIIAKQ